MQYEQTVPTLCSDQYIFSSLDFAVLICALSFVKQGCLPEVYFVIPQLSYKLDVRRRVEETEQLEEV